jgi:hypothetical protein
VEPVSRRQLRSEHITFSTSSRSISTTDAFRIATRSCECARAGQQHTHNFCARTIKSIYFSCPNWPSNAINAAACLSASSLDNPSVRKFFKNSTAFSVRDRAVAVVVVSDCDSLMSHNLPSSEPKSRGRMLGNVDGAAILIVVTFGAGVRAQDFVPHTTVCNTVEQNERVSLNASAITSVVDNHNFVSCHIIVGQRQPFRFSDELAPSARAQHAQPVPTTRLALPTTKALAADCALRTRVRSPRLGPCVRAGNLVVLYRSHSIVLQNALHHTCRTHDIRDDMTSGGSFALATAIHVITFNTSTHALTPAHTRQRYSSQILAPFVRRRSSHAACLVLKIAWIFDCN